MPVLMRSNANSAIASVTFKVNPGISSDVSTYIDVEKFLANEVDRTGKSTKGTIRLAPEFNWYSQFSIYNHQSSIISCSLHR